MPLLTISTNVKKEKIPADFLKTASVAMHETVGKPLEAISVYVNPDQMMAFGGSADPCAKVDFISAGKIGKEENKKHTTAITALMEKLGVPSNRYYILFTDIAPVNVGFKGNILG
ncbi:macrophage migration inhibitory factor-like [Asterias amurensis]|uniref:macrophage migration inhibitory factor-like n=1 Tax=Asterias amurensis TaxID=7602 RepID=UPI003AB19BB0